MAAIELIHKQPVRWTHDQVVACDGGGGPAGVAARRTVVEKKAAVAGEGKREALSTAVLGRPRASIINGFAEAIVRAVYVREVGVVAIDATKVENEVASGMKFRQVCEIIIN